MTDEEYSQTQTQLLLLAQFANDIDLAGFIERINQTEAVAPMLHPTLYIKGATQLHQIKRLALALRPFQEEIKRQVEGETS